MPNAKPPDLADLHKRGELPPHPDDYDGEEMPDPAAVEAAKVEAATLAKAGATVAAMAWEVPGLDWLTVAPPRREYLLHDARDPKSGGLEEHGAGMLPRGKVGILAAAGGVGKTYALCGLALSVVTGRAWLGHFPVGDRKRGRAVLVLGEEDTAELRRRLYTQARAMGLDASHGADAARILALPGAGLDALALTRGEDEGAGVRTAFADGLLAHLRAVAERDGPWDVVILDPLSRFAGPDVEVDNSAATRLIQVLERFAKLPGEPAVIVAHHTTKAARKEGDTGANAVRGASGLTDGARWCGHLEAVPTPSGAAQLPGMARFSVTKSNYAAFPKSIGADGLLLIREDGGGGLRVAGDNERAALTAAELEAARAVGAAKAAKKAAEGEGAKATKPRADV